MTIKDRIAAEKKAAQALIAKGEENLTDAEFEELKGHAEELKKLQGRVELFAGAKDALDAAADGPAKKAPGAKSARTVGEHFVAELKAAGLNVMQAKSKGFTCTEFKAASDAHATGEGPNKYDPYLTELDAPVFQPRRELSVADLFSQGTIAGSILKYPVFSALEGGAKAVAEGAQSNQSHLPIKEWKTDSLHKISTWWVETDEMMEDMPYVASEINDHCLFALDLEEDEELLNGDGSSEKVDGIFHRTTKAIAKEDERTVADRIFHAMTMIRTATGFSADALVISPADYESLRLAKDANGQYFGGGFMMPAYGGTGVLVIEQTPWGLTTVVTPACADKNCLVGAFKAGGKVFRKGGIAVKSTDSHAGMFIEGKTAFLASKRVGLQVKYPDAFVKVSTEPKEVMAMASFAAAPDAAEEPKPAVKNAPKASK